MAIELINAAESGAVVRGKLNSNFSELNAMRQFLLPHVSQQPVGAEVIAGEPVSISVVASSAQGTNLTTTYKRQEFIGGVWQETGEVSSFEKLETEETDRGRKFRWVVSNQVGDVISDVAEITFRDPWDDTIYMLATGQSNMLSRDNADLSITTHPDIHILNNTTNEIEQWNLHVSPAQHKTNAATGNDPYVGYDSLTFYLALKLHEITQKRIVILFACRGGTAIQQWLPGGLIYDNLILQLEHPEIKRIDIHFHHQGENNSTDTSFVSRLQTFRSTLEGFSKYPNNCPMIIGELLRKPGFNAANSRLNEFAAGDPDVEIASSEGLPFLSDELHFTSSGLKELANRMAAFVPAKLPVIYGNTVGDRPENVTSFIGADYGDAKVELSWSPSISSDVKAYYVEKLVGGSWLAIGVLKPTETSFEDDDIELESDYQYRICSVNAYGQRWTTPITVRTLSEPQIVEQPESVTVIDGSTAHFSIAFSHPGATFALYEVIEDEAVLIEDETSNTFSITNVTEADEDRKFRWVVTHKGNEYTSNDFTVSVSLISDIITNSDWFTPDNTFVEITGESATTETPSGGLVGTWRSSRGMNLSPSALSYRPTLREGLLNGRQGVDLSGSARFNDPDLDLLTRNKQRFYFAIVCSTVRDTSPRVPLFLSHGLNGGGSRFAFSMNWQGEAGRALLTLRTTDNATPVYNISVSDAFSDKEVACWIVGVDLSKNEAKIWKNGVLIANQTIPETSFPDTDSLDGILGALASGNFYNGVIGDFLIYSPQDSVPDRSFEDLAKHLMLKYGIPV